MIACVSLSARADLRSGVERADAYVVMWSSTVA